ncbi:unnamed protein product, partial [Prunus brigantina]
MVNLNWPEHKRGKLRTEASSSRGRRVTREANQRPKATTSAGVVLCSECKCESELEVTLDRQSLPTPSVFDRIGTSYQQGPGSRPTLELTRTQKKRVQRQYCTFLKNRDDTQVLPETKGQEDWTEEYEEEQLDYEPSADDQN